MPITSSKVDAYARQLASQGASFVSPTGSGLLVGSGTVVKPTITYNNGGTVTIGTTGSYRFFHTINYSGEVSEHTIEETTLNVPNLITSYIVSNYNSGTPQYSVTTDLSTVNFSNNVVVYTVSRVGDTNVDILDWDEPGLGLSNKILRRDMEARRFERVTGLSLGEDTGRKVVISAGVVWQGSFRNSRIQVDSVTNYCEQVVTDAGGNWTGSIVTAYNNSQFDNGNGLTTLTDGNYAVNWIYRGMGINAENIIILLGTGDYDLNQAKTAQPPNNAPLSTSTNAMLVGKIIVQKGADVAIQIDSAFVTQFAPSATSSHEGLTSIQGGDATHHYHSDQEINKASAVEFNKVTTNLIVANEASTTVAGLMSPVNVIKLDGLSAPLKNNLTAISEPTVNDDSNDGYSEGSIWVYSGTTYTCTSATNGSAVWSSSADMFYFDDWTSLVSAISVDNTTYINKFVTVSNANGGAPSGVTYTAPTAISNPIVDGGSATYKILVQGENYSVVCQKRTVTNPTITSIQNTAVVKPTTSGYYIFTVAPSNGLPTGVSLNDIAYYDGSIWSKFQAYSNANPIIMVGISTVDQVTWSKAAGSWQQTSGLSYMSGYKTVNSAVTTGTIINFVVGDSFNMGPITPPGIPLKVGRTYELRGFVQIVASAPAGARFAFVNASGGAEIPNSSLSHGISYTTTFGGNAGSQPVAGGFYTPTTDITLNFKCVSHTGSPELQYESFRVEVKQLK